MLDFFAILISIASLVGYINHRWLKLPTTIGVMLISVAAGIALKFVDATNPIATAPLRDFLLRVDFSSFVLDFVLCFLLFAGALQVNMSDFKGVWATVISYATAGVLLSTLLIGLAAYAIAGFFGFHTGLIPCFLFGALISPTDPIAVLGILSKYRVPQKLKTEITGESLFNDGMGIALFNILFTFVIGWQGTFGYDKLCAIAFIAILGGIGIGLLIGYLGCLLIKSIDHYQTEVLVTLAIVTGGYSLASEIHASGPLAMVVAGLMVGNKGKAGIMSDTTAEYIDKFWELIDEICTILLFVLMGLEVFLLPYDGTYLIIGSILVLVSIAARYLSLLPAFLLFNRREPRKQLNLSVLTWGGLRGGISIALALSLGMNVDYSGLFLVSTYCIVLFSVLVQGLSMPVLLKKYQR